MHRHMHTFAILSHVAAAHAFLPPMKTELSHTNSYMYEAGFLSTFYKLQLVN